ncbi:hypothetical protein D3C78_1466380 [compost metagenome]
MAFLKLPLLTPNKLLISAGSLLSLTGKVPLLSRNLARIFEFKLVAASTPTGCRLRLILPSARTSLIKPFSSLPARMNLKISFLWIRPQCLLLMIALKPMSVASATSRSTSCPGV